MMELLDTRHVFNACKILPLKTNRKDARGIGQLMLLAGRHPPVVMRQDSLPGEPKKALLNRLMATEFDRHVGQAQTAGEAATIATARPAGGC